MSAEITSPTTSGLVTFTLLINGNSANTLYSVATISTSQEVNKIPYAKITLLDGDVSNQDFEVSNSDDFKPGAEIEVTAGYESDEETIYKGIVTKHAIKAGDLRASTLVIECKSPAVGMTVGRKNLCLHEVTDSEAIEQILSDHGLTPDVEETQVTHKEMVQFHATDWDFVLTRAEANGKLVIVDGDEVKVAAPDTSKTPKLGLSYGRNIFDFEAEVDARFQVETITDASWDPANQEMIKEEGSEGDLKDQGNLSGPDLAGVLGIASFDLLHPGQIPTEELKAAVDAQGLKNRLARIIGRVKIQGNADVQVGDFITLEGVGDRFNGDAFVTAIRHEIAEGNWFTHIQFGLPHHWFFEKNDVSHPPASGLLPGIAGLHIGVVTQLQDDPDSEERILVNIPAIDADDEGIWARVARLDAGEDRGTFFLPEIGDEVVVGYLNDDPRNPVVLGMLHSSSKAAPIVASDDNYEKGIITREKLQLLFNDDVKSIEISTPNGNKALLSDDEGGIILEDESGNKLSMTADGIMMESAADVIIKASGDVTIEGTNIGEKASAEYKAEGGAGAEVSTGAIAVIKGSLVQIN